MASIKLSSQQRARLLEVHDGSRPSTPGRAYLADAGFGWRAARAWYQTYQSLAERGLVTYTGSYPVVSYSITDAGRALVAHLRAAHGTEEAPEASRP